MSSAAGCLIPSPEVPLTGDEHVLVVDRRQRRRRVDDDRAVHAVRDVCQDGLGAAVVHEDTGISRLEAESERIAPGITSLKATFGAIQSGVEVDRMRDRSTVLQRHLHGLAFAHVHDRARGAMAVEGPCVVLTPGAIWTIMSFRVIFTFASRRPGPAGAPRRRPCAPRRAPRVLRHDAGKAIQRQGSVVVGRVIVRRRRHGGICLRTRMARITGVGPHHQRKKPTTATKIPSSIVATSKNALESGSTGWWYLVAAGCEAIRESPSRVSELKVGGALDCGVLARPQVDGAIP